MYVCFSEGLFFIPGQAGLAELPKYTFISAEATSWVLSHIQDITSTADANLFLQVGTRAPNVRNIDIITYLPGKIFRPCLRWH